MQKLCTAGLTGDGRTDTDHTFAPVDLTAPKVAAGKNDPLGALLVLRLDALTLDMS